MAWTSKGSLGATQSKTAGTSIAHTSVTTNAAAGEVVFVMVSKDNITTDANANGIETTEITSVTDSVGGNTWTKAKEWGFGGGAAAAGVITAVYYSVLTNALNTGAVITANFSASVAAKAISAWCLQFGAGSTVTIETTGLQTAVRATDIDANPLTVGGLSNAEHLFMHAIGRESNATVVAGTDGYTELTGATTTGGGATGNIAINGRFRIVTGTSSTSTPGSGGSVDSSSIMFGVTEVAGASNPVVSRILDFFGRVTPRLSTSALTIGLSLLQSTLAPPTPMPYQSDWWTLHEAQAKPTLQISQLTHTVNLLESTLAPPTPMPQQAHWPIYRTPASLALTRDIAVNLLPYIAGDPVGEQHVLLTSPLFVRFVQFEEQVLLPYIAGDPAGGQTTALPLSGTKRDVSFVGASIQSVDAPTANLVDWRAPQRGQSRPPESPQSLLPFIAGDPIGSAVTELPAPRRTPAPKFDLVDSLPFIAGDPIGDQSTDLPAPVVRRFVQYEQPLLLPFIAGDPVRPDAVDRIVRPQKPWTDLVRGWSTLYVDSPVGASMLEVPKPVRRPVLDFVVGTEPYIVGDPVAGHLDDLAVVRWVPRLGFVAGVIPDALTPVPPAGAVASDLPRVGARQAVAFAADALPFITGTPVYGTAGDLVVRRWIPLVGQTSSPIPSTLLTYDQPTGAAGYELPKTPVRPHVGFASDVLPFVVGDPIRPFALDLAVRARTTLPSTGEGALFIEALNKPVSSSSTDLPASQRVYVDRLTHAINLLESTLTPPTPINQTDWPVYRTTATLSIEIDSYPADPEPTPINQNNWPIYRTTATLTVDVDSYPADFLDMPIGSGILDLPKQRRSQATRNEALSNDLLLITAKPGLIIDIIGSYIPLIGMVGSYVPMIDVVGSQVTTLEVVGSYVSAIDVVGSNVAFIDIVGEAHGN